MKKIFTLLMFVVFLIISVFSFSACDKKEKVTIYSSMEDYCLDYLRNSLSNEFPQYKIVVEYLGTSNIASKVIEEKEKSDCDIVFGEEYAFLEKMAKANSICNVSSKYDKNKYVEDTVISDYADYIIPSVRSGGGIILNKKVLSDRGLTIPISYNDLLDKKYKGLISMPNPKSSGTGYMFYLSLVNELGEETAIDYFNSLSNNVLAYTSSGSGPVNSLVQREVAIGLGMVSQAVEKINGGNDELEVVFFKEGAPFNLYGNAIVKGKDERQSVKDVINYITNTFTNENCKKYYPEPVLKDAKFSIENYPTNIKYSNMSDNTIEKKDELLSKWAR